MVNYADTETGPMGFAESLPKCPERFAGSKCINAITSDCVLLDMPLKGLQTDQETFWRKETGRFKSMLLDGARMSRKTVWKEGTSGLFILSELYSKSRWVTFHRPF